METRPHNLGDLLDDDAIRRLAARLVVDGIVYYDLAFLESDACADICMELSGNVEFSNDDILCKLEELGMEGMTSAQRRQVLFERAQDMFGIVGHPSGDPYLSRVTEKGCADCGTGIAQESTRCRSCAAKRREAAKCARA